MDNLLTGSLDNIAHLFGREDFRFVKQDVTEYLYLEGPLDYLLHFASPASPVDYLRYPIQTLKVGSLGTHKALGLAKAKGARFLLASTSEVYGDPQVHPQPEAYWGHVNPVGPRGVYDEAKRFAEALTMAYHRAHGVATRIVRIFNTYGPRMRPHDGRVVSNFLVQALAGQPLTIYGTGQQTRSFCYVTDLVDGLVRLLFSSEVGPGQPRQPHRVDHPGPGHHPRDPPGPLPPRGLPPPPHGRSPGAAARHHSGPDAARVGAHRRSGDGASGDAGVLSAAPPVSVPRHPRWVQP